VNQIELEKIGLIIEPSRSFESMIRVNAGRVEGGLQMALQGKLLGFRLWQFSAKGRQMEHEPNLTGVGITWAPVQASEIIPHTSKPGVAIVKTVTSGAQPFRSTIKFFLRRCVQFRDNLTLTFGGLLEPW
jgi:hypothetical protein